VLPVVAAVPAVAGVLLEGVESLFTAVSVTPEGVTRKGRELLIP
jgi:hypothetical protein